MDAHYAWGWHRGTTYANMGAVGSVWTKIGAALGRFGGAWWEGCRQNGDTKYVTQFLRKINWKKVYLTFFSCPMWLGSCCRSCRPWSDQKWRPPCNLFQRKTTKKPPTKKSTWCPDPLLKKFNKLKLFFKKKEYSRTGSGAFRRRLLHSFFMKKSIYKFQTNCHIHHISFILVWNLF